MPKGHVGNPDAPGRFLRRNIGRTPPDRMVLKAPWLLTWEKSPPRHPAGGRGAETYVAPPSAGRRPAVRPPQVLPPAGPSHLTPSRPKQAESWSDEAPRCPDQNQNPNQKTAGATPSIYPAVPASRATRCRCPSHRLVSICYGRIELWRAAAVFWLGERNWFGHLGASSEVRLR